MYLDFDMVIFPVFLLIDICGKTSAALETLRQSISKGEILTFDAYNFRVLSSAAISYMATCCVFGLGNHHRNVMSSRLSRLFSIFVLPSLTMDVILSVHSPWVTSWLKDIPLDQSIEDIARCIITATKHLYHAVCDQFQPSLLKPHFIFSHHELQKVFLGMYLWQPNFRNVVTLGNEGNLVPGFGPVLSRPEVSVLKITYLWMHECMRTFGDRLWSEDDRRTLVSLIIRTASTHFGIKVFNKIQSAGVNPPTVTSLAIHMLPTDKAGTCEAVNQHVNTLNLPQESNSAEQSDLMKKCTVTENDRSPLKPHCLQPQILHMELTMANLVYGPDLSKVLNQQHNFIWSYQEQNLDVLQQDLCELIDNKEEDKDDNKDNIATKCVVHRQRVKQLLHILRVLLIPGGHGVLIASDRGTGRKTTVRLAAYLTGYQLMEVHPGNENNLHEILKDAANETRVGEVKVIILVHEGISQTVREELLVAMAHRSYPGLHTEEELAKLVSRATEVKKSRRYLMDSWMFEK